jgi:serine/threonine protein kinase
MSGGDAGRGPLDLRRAFAGEVSLQQGAALPEAIFGGPPDLSVPAPGAKGERAGARGEGRPRPRGGPLSPGTILDKYRIEQLLGTGAFGMVYRATHLLLRRPVALKLLRPEVLAKRPGLEMALLREARLAARIDHPNVVRIFDVTRHSDLSYVVMEYLAGSTLSATLRAQAPLEVAEAVRIATGVAEGLRAGLAEGLVHRDVKPDNILLSQDGTPHLADFGLAVAADRVHESGGAVGTRGYMAPEVAAGGAADFRSDLYSLGVTLAECLGLWSSAGPAAAAAAAPPALAGLLSALLQEDPARRPASYDRVIEQLQRALAG